MGSRFSIAALTVVVLFAQPAAAAAADGIWAWLSSLSPPGPFTGPIPSLLATACVQDGDWEASPVGIDGPKHDPSEGHVHPALPCAYVEYSRFKADRDDNTNYPEIGVHLIDIGVTLRLHDGLDIGGGFGRVWFRHNNESTQTEFTKGKFTLTPIRIVMRPLLFVVRDSPRWSRPVGALSVYWKQIYVRGPIRGGDFGQTLPPGQTEFSERSTLAGSFGITVDVTALLPR